MPLSTIIVDDEQLARDELQFLLESMGQTSIVAQGANGIEALSLVKEHKPDLLFLDVQMPGLDGFGVVKKLLTAKAPLPLIVFATAFDQYAVKAFEVNAFDYILKPYDKKRIQGVVEKARRQLSPAPDAYAERLDTLVRMLESQQSPSTPLRAQQAPAKLLLRANGRMFLVDQKDICFASIDSGVITVATHQMEGESSVRTLEELLEMLNPNLFWRAHRGYLVNINRIREVVPWMRSSYQLRMDDRNHTEIPVSRSQTKRLRELFKL